MSQVGGCEPLSLQAKADGHSACDALTEFLMFLMSIPITPPGLPTHPSSLCVDGTSLRDQRGSQRSSWSVRACLGNLGLPEPPSPSFSLWYPKGICSPTLSPLGPCLSLRAVPDQKSHTFNRQSIGAIRSNTRSRYCLRSSFALGASSKPTQMIHCGLLHAELVGWGGALYVSLMGM